MVASTDPNGWTIHSAVGSFFQITTHSDDIDTPNSGASLLAIATRRSLFYHVGKTGGHSVQNMLWRAGLIETQIRPLHIRPIELHREHPELTGLFSFCFVRHPLEWLASVWIHNMSYGATDPTMPDETTFPKFLDAMQERHPGGAVTERLGDYVDACDYVGRLESLQDDLLNALRQAGEVVEDRLLVSVRMNEGIIQELKTAARAPRATLDRLFARDYDFAKRFGYDSIPQHLCSSETSTPLPMLRLKRDLSVAGDDCRREGAVFDHPAWLSNMVELPASTQLRRYNWQVWLGLNSFEERRHRSFAAFLDGDGTIAHAAAVLGFEHATSIAVEPRTSADYLDAILDTTVDRVPFSGIEGLRRTFDVVLHPSFSEMRSPTAALSMLAALLKPSGHLVLRVDILRGVDRPIIVPLTPTQSPMGHLTTLVMSLPALETLLVGSGFVGMEVLDSFMNKLAPEHIPNLEDIATQLELDPENLFSTVLVRARYAPFATEELPSAAALEDAWMLARSLWVADPANVAADAPLRRLADQQRRSLMEVDTERAMARGALADREADLADARRHVQTGLTELENLRRDREILQGALSDREADLTSARSQYHAALHEVAHVQLERDILEEALRDREVDLAREREEVVHLREKTQHG